MEESGLATTATEKKHSTQWKRLLSSTLWKDVRRSLPLAIVDFLSLMGAFWLYRILASQVATLGDGDFRLSGTTSGLALIFLVISGVFLWMLRVRDWSPGIRLDRSWGQVVGAVSFAGMSTSLIGSFAWSGGYDPRAAVLLWALSVVAIPAGELIARHAFQSVNGENSRQTSVILVGSPTGASGAKLPLGPEGHHFKLAGLVAYEDRPSNGQTYDGILGDLDELPQALKTHAKVNGRVVVAVPGDRYSQVRSILGRDPSLDAQVRMVLYPPANGAEAEGTPRSIPRRGEGFKRAFDLALAMAGLTIAAPLIALIAVLIKLDTPGPVFFNHVRVGRRGQLFRLFKFRTMRQDADSMLEELSDQNEASGHMFKMERDPRTTRVGRVLRRLSLDELPQLFNVVQGTMSLVGPRPTVPNEVEQYEPWHFQRFEALPGISGLWQVTRSSHISFEEMVYQDLKYIEKWSLWLDFEILLKTIPAMLRGEGAY